MLTHLLDSEKLGGKPVGGVADRVELVERQKKLGEAGVDPAEEIYQDIQGVPKKQIDFGLKWSKSVKMGPKGSQIVKNI